MFTIIAWFLAGFSCGCLLGFWLSIRTSEACDRELKRVGLQLQAAEKIIKLLRKGN